MANKGSIEGGTPASMLIRAAKTPPIANPAAANTTPLIKGISARAIARLLPASDLLGNPGVELALLHYRHWHCHVGMRQTAQLGALDTEVEVIAIGSSLIGRHVDGGDHPGHGVDLHPKRGHPEGVHHVSRSHLEAHRPPDREDQLFLRSDALLRVGKLPEPPAPLGLHHQLLLAGGVGSNLGQPHGTVASQEKDERRRYAYPEDLDRVVAFDRRTILFRLPAPAKHQHAVRYENDHQHED